MKSLLAILCLATAAPGVSAAPTVPSGNRLTYLDEFSDIYYPNRAFPKLTTPQWIGEPEVDTALVLAIDDMRDTAKYEVYLRPILERLKQIDGRAPASIMTCKVDPKDPQLQTWLKEGVSLEVHTIDHPCPILDKSNFDSAKSTYDRCIDLLASVPGNHPVAFRTPCMDGINSASPRLYNEILERTTPSGRFLTISSSIGVLLTPEDPELPKDLVTDSAGAPRFQKYAPRGWVNYIRDYPYPWAIGNSFWEAGFCIPDDYQGSLPNGDRSPKTVDDMKASIDAVAAKMGLWVMTFHPYNWITNHQVVDLIDHTASKHGKRAKFLNFREVQERIDRNLLAGQPLRRPDGSDNGVRLIDLNGDGYLDVVIGNEKLRQTRIWNPQTRQWAVSDFPVMVAGARFGILQSNGFPSVLALDGSTRGLWHFDGAHWIKAESGAAGLRIGLTKVTAIRRGIDLGVRLRDLDGDGICELIVSNPEQNAVFKWNPARNSWKRLPFALPRNASLVNEEGRDNGLRFVDVDGDGVADLILSNENEYGFWLGSALRSANSKEGSFRAIVRRARGEMPEIPMIVRGGSYPNNSAWFSNETMYLQNEDTGKRPYLLEQLSFKDLLRGLPRTPAGL